MTPADFGHFYKAVHGKDPFPWQERLLEQVACEGWPRTISLPTSSGKTSAIDVAVFHLALEANKNALERQAALRIFFVIDRRVVVDEAAEHALELAKVLLESDEEIVKAVAASLKRFEAKLPLDVAVLRGGMYNDNTWADEPYQPLVCVSTVDQVGSRLLFRGYQVSAEARPVHAALVGNDSLIIIDEAHLSTAFLDTLSAVESEQQSGPPIVRGIEIVRMSATIQPEGAPFQLEEADYGNPVLRKRLEASKPAALRSPVKGFEAELVRAAKELMSVPDVYVVGVVVNTVAAARTVFEDLKRVKSSEAVLLTGRNRPYSSQKLWDQYKAKIAAKPGRVSTERLFVVATQTVEVGANLDFDALVTEAAPLDSLRQRFGRLNRLGNRPEAHAVIVLRPQKEDFIYGEATANAWALLNRLGKVDFGVRALNTMLEGQNLEPVNNVGPAGPLVFARYLEMWAQTNPAPAPDPDVAPFLHGPAALDSADVQVVWRDDLEEDGDDKCWQEAVELAPPVTMEALALPLGVLRKWLRGDLKASVSDIEGLPSDDDEDRPKKLQRALIWRGSKNDTPTTDAKKIRPGDVVVLPTSYGGCDKFGWHPELQEAVEDIGDLANNEMAEKGVRKYRVRLKQFAKTLNGTEAEEFRSLLGKLQKDAGEDPDPEAPEKLARLLPPFPGKPRIDSSGRVAIWPKRVPNSKPLVDLRAKPEDNDDNSQGLERKITLIKHTAGVVEHVRKYASRCGLSATVVKDLVLSARLHDLGKWDDRFQAWLCGGSMACAMKEKEPLAKGDGRLTQVERKQAQESAGYPRNARHEAASVLLADASGALENAGDRDLVLHLVGTHHGYGRPLLPHWEEDEKASVNAQFEGKDIETGTGRELARFSSSWVDRFARMNQKHGYWGLAYLEAILRRADCMQSRKEQDGE